MDTIANQTSSERKPKIRLSSKSEQNALTPKNPKVIFFALDMPAPLASLGLEGDLDGASHVLLLFRDWKRAKAVQCQLSARGIDAPIVEREFEVPEPKRLTKQEVLERLEVQR